MTYKAFENNIIGSKYCCIHSSQKGNQFIPIISDIPIDNKKTDKSVCIRVTKASICEADRRVLSKNKESFFNKKDIILGHEGGGYVLNNENKNFKKFQKTVILPHLSCQSCEWCKKKSPNLCTNLMHLGFHLNGCFTTVGYFPESCVYPLEEIFPEDQIPLIEPLACVIRGLKKISDQLDRAQNLKKKKLFTIYGAGPIGVIASLITKRKWPNVKIKLVDISENRLKLARKLAVVDEYSLAVSKNEIHDISFVASSSFKAYSEAIEHSSNKGFVIMFSGINESFFNDLERREKETVKLFEYIHRRELKISFKQPNKSCNLIGSSGYIDEDIKDSIEELLAYNDFYKRVQNAKIIGLKSSKVLFPLTKEIVEYSNIIEKLLNPQKNNQEEELLAKKILKVLIDI